MLTTIEIEKYAATITINNKIKQIILQAIDKNFYWVNNVFIQDQYHDFLVEVSKNLSDYITKYHTNHHHHTMMPIYLCICQIFEKFCKRIPTPPSARVY